MDVGLIGEKYNTYFLSAFVYALLFILIFTISFSLKLFKRVNNINETMKRKKEILNEIIIQFNNVIERLLVMEEKLDMMNDNRSEKIYKQIENLTKSKRKSDVDEEEKILEQNTKEVIELSSRKESLKARINSSKMDKIPAFKDSIELSDEGKWE
jgi:hypothetical protein